MIGIVGVGLSTNFALQKLYGRGADISGSNLAYTHLWTFDWTGLVVMPVRYADEMKRVENTEKAQTDFLYSKSVENICKGPSNDYSSTGCKR